MDHRIAITGVGLISALGDSPSALFTALCEGRTGVHEIAPGDLGFQCHLAGQIVDFQPEKYLSGRPLRPLDRISQLASAACGLALETSGWNAASRNNVDLSLVVGTMFAGMHTIG